VPADAGEAPEAGDLTAEDPLQLVLGADLELFRPRVTSAEQVSDVSVRGWDPDRKQAVVGTAQAATVSASLPLKPSDLASVFGDATYVVVDRPLSTQNEVDAAAKAVAEQVASAFAGAEGVAKGNPKLRSGAAVSVGLTGAPFEGMYTITTARHVFDNDGYRTHFVVSGRHGRSLLALAAFGGSNGTASGRPATIPGVVTAQVTSVGDSGGQPRVKLSFPWLSETYESDWVRTLQAGAGDGRGFLVLPEVNDEVLVAFEHGDVRRPYVLGGLYNGVDLPKLADHFVDKQTGEVQLRGFMSRKGHLLEFLDGDSEDGITLSTVDEGLQISLDNANTTIKVTSNGDVSIEGSGDVSIRGNRMKLEADAGVSIDAGGGNVTIKGTQIQLN
jgi:uncharacterized protein involved in type VI secretion and phage assembly